LPVSQAIRNELKNFSGVDTTGCGDNFTGGVIASIVNQLSTGKRKLDLKEACSWGTVFRRVCMFLYGRNIF